MKKDELLAFYKKHEFIINAIIILIMLCIVGQVQDNETR